MANLKAEFHEHLTRPGRYICEEMSICLLEGDLKMSKSDANLVSFGENVLHLSCSINLSLYALKKTLEVTKLTGWMNFRMIQAVIKRTF